MSRINQKKSTQVRVPGLPKLPGIWTPGFGVAAVGKPFTSERLKKLMTIKLRLFTIKIKFLKKYIQNMSRINK